MKKSDLGWPACHKFFVTKKKKWPVITEELHFHQLPANG